MPIIDVPLYEEEPEPEPTQVGTFTDEQHARIKALLDIPNKKCPSCGAVNCGLNKKCAYCAGRKGVHTPL